MQVLPILSTFKRHRTAVALIVLEISATCAIVSNTVFLIGDRLSRMERPSGLAEDEVLRVQLAAIGDKPQAASSTAQDLAALRATPGVKYAATANMVPFGNSSWNTDVSAVKDDPNAINTAMYFGSQDLLEAMGAPLSAGRDFTPEEYVDLADVQAEKARPPSAIITRGVVDRLFGGKNPVGQRIYVWGKDPQIIVGVIDRLARPNEGAGPDTAAFAVVLPINAPYTTAGNYLIRVDASRRAEVLAGVDATLGRLDPSRIILERQLFADVRKDYFKQDRSLALLMAGVSIALLVVTAFGIVGLASFWVQQRTRHIGIRRALGATRADILRYFHLENFLLATIGIALGMALSYAINLWLMHVYHVPRLPGTFLPVGAALLWLVGQLSVLGPAMRAATIPPASATRTM
jgi:putative ABC transport system permease protein